MVSVFGVLRRGAICVVALALSLPAFAAKPRSTINRFVSCARSR